MDGEVKLLRPEEASKILKVTTQTLKNWTSDGKLQCIRTKGNHRRYLLSSLSRLINEQQPRPGRKICYCRVSTRSQKEDLDRQIELFRCKYPDHEIISDIGSGLNFKRKGFKTILSSAINGDIQELVVTNRDRLCRFGFEIINTIISENSDGKIVVLDTRETSREKELVDDLISIITVFSSRVYGLRSHKIKKEIREATKESKDLEVQTVS